MRKKPFSEKSRGDDTPKAKERWAVVGNERLTAYAGGILLVLLLVEVVSAVDLHALLSVHVFIGVLLAGPLVVKIGSTGYRFVRYYTKSPAYVEKGPPHIGLRVLSPLLLLTTLVVIGSGIGLVIIGRPYQGALFHLHAISALIWIVMITIHLFAHIRSVPRLIAADWRKITTQRTLGRWSRLGVNLGALVVGVIASVILLPVAAPWIAWSKTHVAGLPTPLIAGGALGVIVIVIARPWKWGGK